MESKMRNQRNPSVGDISTPNTSDSPADLEGSSTRSGPYPPPQGVEEASRNGLLCPSVSFVQSEANSLKTAQKPQFSAPPLCSSTPLMSYYW